MSYADSSVHDKNCWWNNRERETASDPYLANPDVPVKAECIHIPGCSCVPPERETAPDQWIEWGVRRTWGDVGSVAFFGTDYRTARTCAKDWPGVLVSRMVTATDWQDALNNDDRKAKQ